MTPKRLQQQLTHEKKQDAETNSKAVRHETSNTTNPTTSKKFGQAPRPRFQHPSRARPISGSDVLAIRGTQPTSSTHICPEGYAFPSLLTFSSRGKGSRPRAVRTISGVRKPPNRASITRAALTLEAAAALPEETHHHATRLCTTLGIGRRCWNGAESDRLSSPSPHGNWPLKAMSPRVGLSAIAAQASIRATTQHSSVDQRAGFPSGLERDSCILILRVPRMGDSWTRNCAPLRVGFPTGSEPYGRPKPTRPRGLRRVE